MGPSIMTGEAERSRVVDTLRRHAGELRRRGVRRLRVTGSVARGEATPTSDVDLIAEIDRSSVARFSPWTWPAWNWTSVRCSVATSKS